MGQLYCSHGWFPPSHLPCQLEKKPALRWSASRILVFQMRLWLVIRGGSGAAGQVDQAPIWGPLLPLQLLTGDQALL